MRGDELLDIWEHIDPDLIESADRKRKTHWLRWTAIAACFALLVTLAVLPRPPAETPGQTSLPALITTSPTAPSLPDPIQPPQFSTIFNHTICPEKLTGVQILGAPVSAPGTGEQNEPPAFQFEMNLVVEARVVEILPDTYRDALNNGYYKILKLETLDAIVGKNIPQSFYLRLGAWMSSELDRFDSLILSLEQLGIENYMMRNETTHTIEAFTLLFQIYHSYSPHYGSVVAFTDGVMDPSLWELDRWKIGDYYLNKILKGDEYMYYPASEGSTPASTKAEILEWFRDGRWASRLSVITQADLMDDPVFEYVAPFENGVFAHSLHLAADSVHYYRLINGFPTTEQIIVTADSVTHQGETFTQEDLARLPDIGALLESLDLDTLTPPHMDFYEGMNLRLYRQGAAGKYAKVDGQLYGIVSVTWQYIDQDITCSPTSYYDALYYLLSPDGSCHTVEREELTTLLGDDPMILSPEYGVPIVG